MGRLDNIVARNRRPNRLQERVIVSMMLGAIILLVIGLAVFTDLGLPPELRDAREAAPAAAPAVPVPASAGPASASPGSPAPASAASSHRRRVNGVLLRMQPARPTTAPAQAH